MREKTKKTTKTKEIRSRDIDNCNEIAIPHILSPLPLAATSAATCPRPTPSLNARPNGPEHKSAL